MPVYDVADMVRFLHRLETGSKRNPAVHGAEKAQGPGTADDQAHPQGDPDETHDDEKPQDEWNQQLVDQIVTRMQHGSSAYTRPTINPKREDSSGHRLAPSRTRSRACSTTFLCQSFLQRACRKDLCTV